MHATLLIFELPAVVQIVAPYAAVNQSLHAVADFYEQPGPRLDICHRAAGRAVPADRGFMHSGTSARTRLIRIRFRFHARFLRSPASLLVKPLPIQALSHEASPFNYGVYGTPRGSAFLALWEGSSSSAESPCPEAVERQPRLSYCQVEMVNTDEAKTRSHY